MRIALLSDIHGNSIALDAVLEDMRRVGTPDGYVIVGDLAAIGHDPIGVLQRVSDLPNAQEVRGNTDRYTTSLDRPAPTRDEAIGDPTLLPVLVSVAQSFAWTQGMVTAGGWFDWLRELPLDLRIELPDGSTLLAVHASPGMDDGPGVHPALSRDELRQTMAGADADIVCVGHTHWPMDIDVAGVRVVNLGSASHVYPPDLRVTYSVVEATRNGYAFEHYRVAYDREATVEELRRVHHPSADYITSLIRGQRAPLWQPAHPSPVR